MQIGILLAPIAFYFVYIYLCISICIYIWFVFGILWVPQEILSAIVNAFRTVWIKCIDHDLPYRKMLKVYLNVNIYFQFGKEQSLGNIIFPFRRMSHSMQNELFAYVLRVIKNIKNSKYVQ